MTIGLAATNALMLAASTRGEQQPQAGCRSHQTAMLISLLFCLGLPWMSTLGLLGLILLVEWFCLSCCLLCWEEVCECLNLGNIHEELSLVLEQPECHHSAPKIHLQHLWSHLKEKGGCWSCPGARRIWLQ